MNSKKGHVYEEEFPVQVEYTYDKPGYKKVYNIDKLKRIFNKLLEQFQEHNNLKSE
jgi:hypothetical protein|tara:strand:+ start:127 stop:294 length:168 start_codon:yes stop_codon:yes gene_type:complete